MTKGQRTDTGAHPRHGIVDVPWPQVAGTLLEELCDRVPLPGPYGEPSTWQPFVADWERLAAAHGLQLRQLRTADGLRVGRIIVEDRGGCDLLVLTARGRGGWRPTWAANGHRFATTEATTGCPRTAARRAFERAYLGGNGFDPPPLDRALTGPTTAGPKPGPPRAVVPPTRVVRGR